jgi:hypothetical protein
MNKGRMHETKVLRINTEFPKTSDFELARKQSNDTIVSPLYPSTSV